MSVDTGPSSIERPIARDRGASTTATASGAIVLMLAALALSASTNLARSQALTPDPGAWRPLAYANLQKPSKRDATYVDIWKDAIDANNSAYLAHGDRRYSGVNAPAIEAHFVIWSAKRSVVLSLLDTALGCSEKSRSASAVVKLCPMRVAIYEGLRVGALDAGRGCFVEPAPGATINSSTSAAFAAYDAPARTLKIGVIVNSRAVDGCAFTIPLDRSR
jgi:hypothetical protein